MGTTESRYSTLPASARRWKAKPVPLDGQLMCCADRATHADRAPDETVVLLSGCRTIDCMSEHLPSEDFESQLGRFVRSLSPEQQVEFDRLLEHLAVEVSMPSYTVSAESLELASMLANDHETTEEEQAQIDEVIRGILAENPESFVGEYRRMGPDGPAYEIIRVLSRSDDDVMFEIELLTSGKRVEYPLREVLGDHPGT